MKAEIKVVLALLMVSLVVVAEGRSQPDPNAPLVSLKTVPVPLPDNLDQFVRDRDAAIQLGKALFWDMQVGSDGVQACASCHFHAGADSRFKNSLSPSGPSSADVLFESGQGPNSTLSHLEFPRSKANNDVTSSQGVLPTTFVGVVGGQDSDLGTPIHDAVFNVNGVETRRVEPRNSPTVINAIFNDRNFWDGRANNIFNGVDPFGLRNLNARVWVTNSTGTSVWQEQVVMPNASTASQAVGPPLSGFEMSYEGRSFRDIARKLALLRPLAKQWVHPDDSVLGPLARSRKDPDKKGLRKRYHQLIAKAFQPRYWRTSRLIDGYTLMETNFSLFFGIAVMLYESTLVSDDAPIDRFLEGQTTALTPQQQFGMDVFLGVGRCINCHDGANFSKAAVFAQLQAQNANAPLVERMIMGNGQAAIYDNGFYNIAVRATAEDVGVGGTGPFGFPLSFSRQVLIMAGGGAVPDPFQIDPAQFEVFPGQPVDPNERVAVDGAFKTPLLRNVELTGPYFHNGGMATLRQVVDFYDRGGDFAAENAANLDADIVPLGLTEEEKEALVAFMLALTDDRVRYRKAPFDHPQLFVPVGHVGDMMAVTDDGSGQAVTDLQEIAAVGSGGGTPLAPFLALSPFQAKVGAIPEFTQLDPEERRILSQDMPARYALYQNYPNPFNPSTSLVFDLPEDAFVRIEIFNVLGQKVKTLVDQDLTAGVHRVVWDGRNELNMRVESGTYVYKMSTPRFTRSKTMTLLK